MQKRILIITTSVTQLGSTGKTTGVWAEELVVPYYEFVQAGISVEIASAQGGPVAFDSASLEITGEAKPLIDRFKNDAQAQALAAKTQKTAEVEADRFDAVYFAGGHGTMWDLPIDPGVQRVVETLYAQSKWITSVCHGAAGLLSARRPDGQPIVQGQRINSFTNAEEDAVGLSAVVPFMLESRLRELGAVFEGGANWQPFAIQDGLFITGQNPLSSVEVARKLVQALAYHHA
jgi:putative intracellular protease/amidase